MFGSNGFDVSLVLHKEILVRTWSKNRPLTEMNEQLVDLLFVAKQLRLSDHQASFCGLVQYFTRIHMALCMMEEIICLHC